MRRFIIASISRRHHRAASHLNKPSFYKSPLYFSTNAPPFSIYLSMKRIDKRISFHHYYSPPCRRPASLFLVGIHLFYRQMRHTLGGASLAGAQPRAYIAYFDASGVLHIAYMPMPAD